MIIHTASDFFTAPSPTHFYITNLFLFRHYGLSGSRLFMLWHAVVTSKGYGGRLWEKIVAYIDTWPTNTHTHTHYPSQANLTQTILHRLTLHSPSWHTTAVALGSSLTCKEYEQTSILGWLAVGMVAVYVRKLLHALINRNTIDSVH